jgi:hypothetical protein
MKLVSHSEQRKKGKYTLFFNVVSKHPVAIDIIIYFQLFTVHHARVSRFKINFFQNSSLHYIFGPDRSSAESTKVPLNISAPADGRVGRNM